MTSIALKSFMQSMEEIKTLLTLLPSGNLRKNRAASDAINRAATVLLVSHFENYLKSLAEEFIEDVSQSGKCVETISQGLRELYFQPRLDEILRCNNPQQRMRLNQKLEEFNCLWKNGAKLPPRLLEARVLSRTITAARSEVIDQLFSYFGADKNQPVTAGSIDIKIPNEGPTVANIRRSLEDIIGCRNRIAHGDRDAIPTDQDVKRYRLFLEEFARRLDKQEESLRSP